MGTRGRGRFVFLGCLAALLGGFVATGALATEPAAALARVLEAAGAGSVRTTYLKIGISEEETVSGGKTEKRTSSLWVRFPELDPVRLELAPQVVLVRKKDKAWAVVKGKVDKRPQVPGMVRGTQNEKLFPLLLPFSLQLKGVHPEAGGRTKFEGQSLDRYVVRFDRNFFGTPIMNTEWTVLADPETHRVVTASFVPAPEYRREMEEGVRYRYLRWTKVAGATLPQTVVIEGFDPGTGRATGHVNVLKLTYRTDPNPPVELFVNPEELERLDEGE